VTPSDPSAAITPAAPEVDRPMGAIYAAVIVCEIVTLLALWWFQTTFSRP
jgi:hypothetical protein